MGLFIWSDNRKRLSFSVVKTFAPGKRRIDSIRVRRHAKPGWPSFRTSFWTSPVCLCSLSEVLGSSHVIDEFRLDLEEAQAAQDMKDCRTL